MIRLDTTGDLLIMIWIQKDQEDLSLDSPVSKLRYSVLLISQKTFEEMVAQ